MSLGFKGIVIPLTLGVGGIIAGGGIGLSISNHLVNKGASSEFFIRDDGESRVVAEYVFRDKKSNISLICDKWVLSNGKIERTLEKDKCQNFMKESLNGSEDKNQPIIWLKVEEELSRKIFDEVFPKNKRDEDPLVGNILQKEKLWGFDNKWLCWTNSDSSEKITSTCHKDEESKDSEKYREVRNYFDNEVDFLDFLEDYRRGKYPPSSENSK
ncbi:hypothetical protein [Mycoplasma suis]|uniref:Uncharacterized protein n=1 Tax=Mycoplasma suis (strain Illinois) TaxID=768700 RepID=F0QQE8_MYCSL|nr:hypothetical protein [Mycoplasma suis]ADX97718.1 hypothetical protein MSU_0174 [Mycoplasma suis str. Illinois]